MKLTSFLMFSLCIFFIFGCQLDPDSGENGTEETVEDNTDLDGDGIPDSQDSDIDGDGLSNQDEISYSIDPRKADTDGDGWSDAKELSLFDRTSDPYRFNPKVADMPRLQVVMEKSPEITMDYWTQDSTSTSTSITESKTFSETRTASNSYSHSYAVEYGWSVENMIGVEHEFGTDGGTSLKWELTTGAHGSYTNQDTYAWDTSQAQSNQQTYSEINTIASEESKRETGGKIEIPVTIKNVGNIAYTINSLTLSAYTIAPRSDGELATTIGALRSEGGVDFTINPGESTGVLNFRNNNLYVSDVLDLLANSRGIMCDIGGYSVTLTTDDGTTDFSYEGTTVSAQTAKIIIDYGPTVTTSQGDPKPAEQYNVATRTKYNPDHTGMDDRYFPITMKDIMDSLYITYETGTYDGNNGLVSVRGVQSDIPNNTSWFVVHIYTRDTESYIKTYEIEGMSYDFDAIEVHTGDTVEIIYSEDKDEDGLAVRTESLVGTEDDKPDEDGDTLTDYQEVSGWELDGTGDETVCTSPTLADTDGDGLNDNADDEPLVMFRSSDATLSGFTVNGVQEAYLVSPMLDSDSLPDPFPTTWNVNNPDSRFHSGFAAGNTYDSGITSTYPTLTDLDVWPFWDDRFELSVTPTTEVLALDVEYTDYDGFEQSDSLLNNDGTPSAAKEIGPLSFGENRVDIAVTSLDNSNEKTYTLNLNSVLAPVHNFSAETINGDVDSLRLYWSKPEDSRITDMLIITREESPVGTVTPGYYEVGEQVENDGGTVIGTVKRKFEIGPDLTGADASTEVCTINGLDAGTTYYFKAINVCERSGPEYFFSDIENEAVASTDTPPAGDMNIDLYYLESLNDRDKGTKSDVYWDIYAEYNGAKIPLSSISVDIALSEHVGDPEHFFSFKDGTTTGNEPTVPKQYWIPDIAREDGAEVKLYINLYEHDDDLSVSGSEDYDKGEGNDDVYVKEVYTFTYDYGNDSWSCDKQPGVDVDAISELDYGADTDAGTIRLKLGVYWQ